MWDKFQKALEFLTKLPMLPKAIISVVIVGAVVFLLVMIWFPPPTAPEPEPAVGDILSGCYRRALFTRMHAQLSTRDMTTSIDACRITVQMNIPKIHNKELRQVAVKLLGTIDQILHLDPTSPDNWAQIDQLKLEALRSFKELAAATGDVYLLPDDGKLAEGYYFNLDDASKPLTPDEINAGNQQPVSSGK